MNAVVARIVLRYAAGFFIAWGFVSSDMGASLATDPDVLNLLQIGIGALLGAASELWYYYARKFGWAK